MSFLRLNKIPTPARILAPLFFCLITLFSGPALAQTSAQNTTLRESDIIRLAQERAPGALIATATEQLAQSTARTAGLAPNPSLVWARESVNTGPFGNRGSQDLLGLNFPIDVARTNTTRSLVAAESTWLKAEASLSRNEAILKAVLTFYDVALAEERVQVLSDAVANLDEAARVQARKQSAGSVSGYEGARLSIESELSRSRLTEAEAAWGSEKVRLAALLGQSTASLDLEADLTLLSKARREALARASGAERPALKLAQTSAQKVSEAKRRAAFSWFPTVEIGAGLKRANNAGADDGFGYFVGANIGLPLFDYGQGQKATASAQQTLIAARTEALTRQVAADIQSALLLFENAQDELERFDQATSEPVEQLLRAARSGYSEGERTIVELLDAQRARTEVALRKLHLIASAKRAEVLLRSAAGQLR